eukprot:6211892-Pleurochrysis_carterae.AAC.1
MDVRSVAVCADAGSSGQRCATSGEAIATRARSAAAAFVCGAATPSDDFVFSCPDITGHI